MKKEKREGAYIEKPLDESIKKPAKQWPFLNKYAVGNDVKPRSTPVRRGGARTAHRHALVELLQLGRVHAPQQQEGVRRVWSVTLPRTKLVRALAMLSTSHRKIWHEKMGKRVCNAFDV
jgi:hypothetical protein